MFLRITASGGYTKFTFSGTICGHGGICERINLGALQAQQRKLRVVNQPLHRKLQREREPSLTVKEVHKKWLSDRRTRGIGFARFLSIFKL